jgi:hypothetical protein
MRSKITTLLIAAASVFALSGVAVASASAHEFHSSKEGTLKGRAAGATEGGIQLRGFSCNQVPISGKVKAGFLAALNQTVTFKQCEGGGSGYTFTAMELEANANGTARLLNTATMTEGGTGCVWSIAPSGNEKLTVHYASNKNGTVTEAATKWVLQATVPGEKSPLCAKEHETINITGNWLVEVEGGILSWA